MSVIVIFLLVILLEFISLTQSDAHPTGNQEVVGLIPA